MLWLAAILAIAYVLRFNRLRRMECKINRILRLLEDAMSKTTDSITALQAQAALNVAAETAAIPFVDPNADAANAAAIDAVTANLKASGDALTAAEAGIRRLPSRRLWTWTPLRRR